MEKYLKPEDVAERLSLTKDQVLEFARKGILPSIRFNERVIRFAEAELVKFLQERGKQ